MLCLKTTSRPDAISTEVIFSMHDLSTAINSKIEAAFRCETGADVFRISTRQAKKAESDVYSAWMFCMLWNKFINVHYIKSLNRQKRIIKVTNVHFEATSTRTMTFGQHIVMAIIDKAYRPLHLTEFFRNQIKFTATKRC